ncbi:MAG: class I SAM-dependent methyltransferase [Bryobacteraceae bacterium]
MSLRKRIHAVVLAKLAGRYESAIAERKKALFADLRGDILEIGPGTGPNLAHYPPGIRWTGLEPNPFMHSYLRESAHRAGVSVKIVEKVAERLDFEDSSLDGVVSTLVLCSVTDPAAVIGEIRRVLKPGGRFAFIEHVAASSGTRLRQIQRWIRPLWKVLGDGCHPDRETWTLIEQGGFTQVRLEHFQMPLGPASPHIAGIAIK